MHTEYFETSVDLSDLEETECAVSALVDPMQVPRAEQRCAMKCPSVGVSPALDSGLDLSVGLNVCTFSGSFRAPVLCLVVPAGGGFDSPSVSCDVSGVVLCTALGEVNRIRSGEDEVRASLDEVHDVEQFVDVPVETVEEKLLEITVEEQKMKELAQCGPPKKSETQGRSRSGFERQR